MTETTLTPDPDDAPVECPECHGAGLVTVTLYTLGERMEMTCAACKGAGTVSPMLAGILKRRGV